ncbi:MAG: DUF4339 domain-containing protein [Verrucomicrobiae bacterium]|nr:DUF4339 domain-containing protein [Verrucomicrobiae bacterium]MCP5539129.1 DUF4339 domain-containing protein [Akkermansiaceae bacterium]MCP5549780.1 DUF4339 domain-containing protein [Akkermansiaceae bacterium]
MEWFYIDAEGNQTAFEAEALGDFVADGKISGGTQLWNETMAEWQPARELFPAWFSGEDKEEAPAAPEPAAETGETPAEATDFVPVPVPPKHSAMFAAAMQEEEKPAPLPPAEPPRDEPVPMEEAPARPLSRPTVSRAVGSLRDTPQLETRETVKDMASYITANRGWLKFVGIMSIIGGSLLCLSVIYALVGWLPIWLGVTLLKCVTAADLAESTGSADELGEALYRLNFYFKLKGITLLIGLIVSVVSVIVMTLYMAVIMAALAPGLEGMDDGGPPPAGVEEPIR